MCGGCNKHWFGFLQQLTFGSGLCWLDREEIRRSVIQWTQLRFWGFVLALIIQSDVKCGFTDAKHSSVAISYFIEGFSHFSLCEKWHQITLITVFQCSVFSAFQNKSCSLATKSLASALHFQRCVNTSYIGSPCFPPPHFINISTPKSL